MTKLLSLLSIGMFDRTMERVDGRWVPQYKVEVRHPHLQALQAIMREGQCLVDDFYHNASWYNKLGEKLGWGDLNRTMVQAIQAMLPAGEVFVICYESASFWEMRGQTEIDPIRPGVDWLCENAALVITPCGLYVPPSKYDDDRWTHMEKINLRGAKDLPARKVSRQWVRDVLDTANRMECFMDDDQKFIVAPVENPPLVEELLPHPWSVGDGWTCSRPEQEQADGRWKLYVYDEGVPAGYKIRKLAENTFQVTGPDFRQTWRTYDECRGAAKDDAVGKPPVSVFEVE